nr:phosphate regulon sensor histidine kinase PhoR [Motiliproteus sediminis]
MSQQLKRLALLVTAAMALGWLLGYPFVALSLALLTLLAKSIYQQQRLLHWLKKDDGSEVPEASGSWEDIYDSLYHRLKGHRQREAQLKSVIDRIQESTQALRDGVVMIDSNGEIDWWNRAATRMLGLKRPDDVGQAITNLIRDPRFIRYFDQRDYTDPLELPATANRQLQLQFTLTEFGRSERLMLIRDVSRLHALERMRRDFVGNASHELRTPLTVIRGYLETLQDQCDELPLFKRALLQMEGQAKRMGSLVNDMLMLTRLETTDSLLDSSPVDVGQLLREVHGEAQLLAQERGHQITLEIDERYLLMGQERELFSAFSNLVMNAIKYTPDAGTIRVNWWVDDQGGHFSVSDSGIGIDAHHISRLTERFYRVDDGRSRAQGGTGLGLAIVKHVLIRHAARLEVDSTPNVGSTFSCHFPAHQLRPLEQSSAG